MSSFNGDATVVAGDIKFTATVDLHADQPINGGQSSWWGTVTAKDAMELEQVLANHGGLLLLPKGRQGDFLVHPQSGYVRGSLQMQILGSGTQPF
jgi:hypothetical protein